MNAHLKIAAATLMTMAALTACGGDSYTSNSADGNQNQSSSLASVPVESLNADEQASLLYIREEEKLAYDVYIKLNTQWGGSTPTFGNISNSEAKHQESVHELLVRYNLTDTASSLSAGVFNNAKLQNLHTQLVNTGATSLVDALKVGAAIEEIDIIDIQADMAKVDNQDIRLVYGNLMKGSRNHLRAFVKNLANQGVTYVPQYMNPSDYQAIINSPTEN
ncbi:MAG TPA: DUF2202 domain-containing protein [Burkholderiaceae bacterium]|nr:DUF2202 domain-containing protein [Burkholderiaceae bacterium]